jgi:allantoicase
MSSLRAFVASTAQGVVYDTGIWHHPLICLETVSKCDFLSLQGILLVRQDIDFACVETQAGGGHPLDCEILELDPSNGYPRVSIPTF